MMLYPPVPQMLKSVPSRYLLVNVIARRARQVAIEEEEFKIPMDKMAVSEAIDEIAEGKIVAAVKEEYLRPAWNLSRFMDYKTNCLQMYLYPRLQSCNKEKFL